MGQNSNIPIVIIPEVTVFQSLLGSLGKESILQNHHYCGAKIKHSFRATEQIKPTKSENKINGCANVTVCSSVPKDQKHKLEVQMHMQTILCNVQLLTYIKCIFLG